MYQPCVDVAQPLDIISFLTNMAKSGLLTSLSVTLDMPLFLVVFEHEMLGGIVFWIHKSVVIVI